MESTINKRNWWIVPVVGGVLAVAVIVIQRLLLPDYAFFAFLICIGILAITFYWVYIIDKEQMWWALVVALVMVALLVTGTVAFLTPKDASNSSPYGVVTLGLCAAIIGLILKRPAAKIVFYIIGIITLLVGILMLPLDLIWQIILIVVEAVVIGYLTLRAARQLPKK